MQRLFLFRFKERTYSGGMELLPTALILRSSADVLLGRSRPPSSSDTDVEAFNKFYTETVAKVRSRTGNASPSVCLHWGFIASVHAAVR